MALVERGGKARAVHMNTVTAKNIGDFLAANADKASQLHTEESNLYPARRQDVREPRSRHPHSKGEYARGKGPDLVTTNSAEGFFGVLVRGMTGVYQHCREQHLQRYLDEFSFRHSHRVKLGVEDEESDVIANRNGEGKRLTWRRPDEA